MKKMLSLIALALSFALPARSLAATFVNAWSFVDISSGDAMMISGFWLAGEATRRTANTTHNC